MYLFLIILVVFVVLYALFLFSTRKFVNPYKLELYIGKKGSGKSTLATKIAQTELKRISKGKSNWEYVFTNFYSPNCRKFDISDVGVRNFPEYSLIIIDEAGIVWDNREFKNFSKEVRDWFKFQRKHKCKVILISQSFDIDKKLRDLVDRIYIVKSFARVFSIAKEVQRQLVVVKASAEAPSRIDEDLVIQPFIFWFFGSRILTYIPRWTKFFDSFSVTDSCQGDISEEFWQSDNTDIVVR